MHKKNRKIKKSLAAVHRIDRVHCASCLYEKILCYSSQVPCEHLNHFHTHLNSKCSDAE